MALINTPPAGSVDEGANPVSAGYRGFFNSVFSLLAGLTQSGTTAKRPTASLWTGRPYFDSTLDVPIWWDGTAWVRSNGLAGAVVTSFARPAASGAGTQAITGIGFTPRLVLFLMVVAATANASWGANSATTPICTIQTSAGVMDISGTYSIFEEDAAGNYSASITSFDADGFTLTWATTGAPPGTLSVIAICLK